MSDEWLESNVLVTLGFFLLTVMQEMLTMKYSGGWIYRIFISLNMLKSTTDKIAVVRNIHKYLPFLPWVSPWNEVKVVQTAPGEKWGRPGEANRINPIRCAFLSSTLKHLHSYNCNCLT